MPRRALLAVPLVLVAILGALVLLGRATHRRATLPAADHDGTAYLEESRRTFDVLEAPADGVWRRLAFSDGTTLDLPAPPSRVVSQALGADEVLLEILPPERLLAVSRFAVDPHYSNVPERAEAVPHHVSVSTEEILALRPDLVVTTSFTTLETLAQLRRAGAPVLQLTGFESLDDVRANIRLLGAVVGADGEAASLVAMMDRRLAALGRPPGVEPTRIVACGDGWALGGRTLFDSVVRAVGAVNVTAERGFAGWPKLSPEEIARWRIDAFVVSGDPGPASGSTGDTVADRLWLERHPALSQTTAVRTGRVLVVPTREMEAVSHHVVRFAERLHGALYGPTAARAAPTS